MAKNTAPVLNIDYAAAAKKERETLYKKKKGKRGEALNHPDTYLSDPSRNLPHAGHVVKYIKSVKPGSRDYKGMQNVIDLEKKAMAFEAKHHIKGGGTDPKHIRTVVNEYGTIPKDVYTPEFEKSLVGRLKGMIKHAKDGAGKIFSSDMDIYADSYIEANNMYLDILEMNNHDQKFIKRGRKALDQMRKKQQQLYENKEQETYKKISKKYK